MIPRFSPSASIGDTLAFLGGLISGRGTGKGEVRNFEQAFAEYVGAQDAAFVPAGRMGLLLMLQAKEYPKGSEIILPAFTYFAIPAVVQLAGLTPVYAEIDPQTYELTPESVAAVISPRTRAVVPTHLFGRTCDLDGLAAVCKDRGIDIIEDCAQSLGARYKGKRCGAVGDMAYFTFGITKNLTTFGGAMITAQDKALVERVRQATAEYPPARAGRLLKQSLTALAMHAVAFRPAFNLGVAPVLRLGRQDGPDAVHCFFEEAVSALSLDGLQRRAFAPVDAQGETGQRQLLALDGRNDQCRRHGAKLLSLLQERGITGLPQAAPPSGDHIYMSFAILRSDRYRCASLLRKRGVDVSPGYMSDCAAIPELGGKAGKCPISARVASEVLHVPLYPRLSSRDLERIADAIFSL